MFIVELATHNGKHTNTYFKYVYEKLNSAYKLYGPEGDNYNSVPSRQKELKFCSKSGWS